MIEFNRNKVEPPDWLILNWKKWGKQAINQRNKGKEVDWYTFNKVPINQHLIPLLTELTENHCSFCDGFPMRGMTDQIEHFKPKSKFPELSHQWENLYLICSKCNEHKGDDFDDLLLRPDEADYSFSKYFTLEPDGILVPDKRLNEFDKSRVDKTIELYGLNDHGRPDLRVEEISKNLNNSSGLYRYIYY
jgi:uncharacterized protein (TIGR02646 family)